MNTNVFLGLKKEQIQIYFGEKKANVFGLKKKDNYEYIRVEKKGRI